MFGLKDKAQAMIAGGLAGVLAMVLAFVWITKDAEIGALERSINAPVTGYAARLAVATSDLATCRSNRITLEEASHRQSEAVAAANAAGAERLAELQGALSRAQTDATAARIAADRILASKGTGDVCADADALILGEIE